MIRVISLNDSFGMVRDNDTKYQCNMWAHMDTPQSSATIAIPIWFDAFAMRWSSISMSISAHRCHSNTTISSIHSTKPHLHPFIQSSSCDASICKAIIKIAAISRQHSVCARVFFVVVVVAFSRTFLREPDYVSVAIKQFILFDSNYST